MTSSWHKHSGAQHICESFPDNHKTFKFLRPVVYNHGLKCLLKTWLLSWMVYKNAYPWKTPLTFDQVHRFPLMTCVSIAFWIALYSRENWNMDLGVLCAVLYICFRRMECIAVQPGLSLLNYLLLFKDGLTSGGLAWCFFYPRLHVPWILLAAKLQHALYTQKKDIVRYSRW